MNFIRSNNLSLKYKMYSPSRKLIFVSFFGVLRLWRKNGLLKHCIKRAESTVLWLAKLDSTSKCIYIIQCTGWHNASFRAGWGVQYKAPWKHVKVCFERVNDESLVEFEALFMLKVYKLLAILSFLNFLTFRNIHDWLIRM